MNSITDFLKRIKYDVLLVLVLIVVSTVLAISSGSLAAIAVVLALNTFTVADVLREEL